MSKQPREVRDALTNLKSMGIVLPELRNPLQHWILVIQHPRDGNKGEVFISHAQNATKFHTRPNFEVLAHSYDKFALRQIQRHLTLQLGEAYQPKFSAHNLPLSAPTGAEPASDLGTEADTMPDPYEVLGPITTSGDQ